MIPNLPCKASRIGNNVYKIMAPCGVKEYIENSNLKHLTNTYYPFSYIIGKDKTTITKMNVTVRVTSKLPIPVKVYVDVKTKDGWVIADNRMINTNKDATYSVTVNKEISQFRISITSS